MLKGIRKQVRRPRLSEELFQRIKALGILKPFRGGIQNKNKQHGVTKQIDTVINTRRFNLVRGQRNASNLIPIKTVTEEKTEYLTCLYLNARSVNKKTDEITEMIEDKRADLVLIAETWLRSGDNDVLTQRQLTPPGYSLIHQPRKGQKKGGGVAMLFRDNLKLRSQVDETSYKTFEHLELRLQTGGEDILVSVFYRPPDSSLTDFYEEFTTFVDSCATRSGRLLLVGDFNIHVDDKQGNRLAFRRHGSHEFETIREQSDT